MVTNRVTRRIIVAVWVVATVVLPQINASAGATGSTRVFVLPDAHAEPVRSLLRGARQSIRLEVYLLTNRALIGELQRARQRGVDVRVLLEEHPFGGNRYAQLGYTALQRAGIPMRWANERAFRFTHDKAVTVDGQIAGIFSFNLTSSGLLRNREFGVIDSDANDARALAEIFDADWSRRAAHYRPSHLVISPYNSRRSFYTLIGSASRTLELYAEEVNDTAIENRLVAAARRGVHVRLITSQGGPGIEALRRGGVSVHVVSSPYIHAKATVADRATLFIGSENISTTSLDQNREIGVLLHDPTGISTVESTFASDWRRASTGVPAPTGSASAPMTVHVTATPSVVHRGQRIIIAATTASSARCSVQVTYQLVDATMATPVGTSSATTVAVTPGPTTVTATKSVVDTTTGFGSNQFVPSHGRQHRTDEQQHDDLDGCCRTYTPRSCYYRGDQGCSESEHRSVKPNHNSDLNHGSSGTDA